MKPIQTSLRVPLGVLALLLAITLPTATAGNALSMTSFINAANYTTLQAAVDALPYCGGTIFLPPGVYTLDAPLNLADTFDNGLNTKFITLQGSGKLNTTITGNFPDYEIVDATGAGYLTIKDLGISGTAKCLFLSARTATSGPNGKGGGGNYFENVIFRADNCDVGLDMNGSEVNRFVNCEFLSSKAGCTLVLFSGYNDNSLASMYSTIASGQSTTALEMIGCTIGAYGANSIGLRADGSCANIYLRGGYIRAAGLAGIYLDGARGTINNVGFYGVRTEGEGGQYALYAQGSVNNLVASECNWTSSNDVIRYVSLTNSWMTNSPASSWELRNNSFAIQQQDGVTYTAGTGGHTILRIDAAKECNFQNIWTAGYDASWTYYNPQFLYASGMVSGCRIETTSSNQTVVLANATNNQGNVRDVHYDGGQTRRIYHQGGAASYPTVLNMEETTTAVVASPKAGDLIMLKDGGGTGIPCLAYYTGSAWKKLIGQ